MVFERDQTKFKNDFARTQGTKVEAKRREVRHQIIASAEIMWQSGGDPHPVQVTNILGKVVASVSNPTLPTAKQWELFRNRKSSQSLLHSALATNNLTAYLC